MLVNAKLWRRRIGLATVLAGALILGGCGGGSDSGGGGGQVQVTVTPTIVGVTLNGSQQFSASVTGTRRIPIASSNGAARAANVVTITTTEAHGLQAGHLVNISGVTDATFNGTFTVDTVPSSTTFTYAQVANNTTSGSGTASNVSVNWQVNDVDGGNSTVGTISKTGLYTAPSVLPSPVTASITSNGAARASTTVTITTTQAHNLVVGQVVVISGVSDTSFNGTFLIASVPSTTTFSYNQSGNNATSGGGTVSTFGVKVKAISVADSSKNASATINLVSGVTLLVTPSTVFVGTTQAFPFSAVVTGTSNTGVNWSVNNTPGGNASVGTISASGVYTAPASPPTSNTVSIASSGAVRVSNVVTITTSVAHGFQIGQSVTIAGVSDSSFNGTFPIATIPSITSFTYAQNGSDVTSGGGTAASVTNSVTIQATSVVDPTVSATAIAFIRILADPTLTSISPTVGAQGSLFQDVVLTGTNFLSTTIVRANGTEVTAKLSASGDLRARIPQELLASLGTVAISVQQQGGAATAALNLTVVPVRPALVGPSPDSATQSGGAVSVNFNGGYYSSSVVAEFNGQPRASSLTSSRQLNVAIGASDLSTAGLFSITVRNDAATPSQVSTNLAVQPSAAPAAVATLPVGTQPASVAVNTATGIAVVANRGSNNLTLIDLSTSTVLGTVAVGTSPTSVAVDNLRNLAVVVNNGSRTLSVVDLATRTVTATISNVGNSPIAVSVNPLTGLGIVANQSTNTATVFDLNTNAVTGTVSIGTGENPQVDVEPRLNWALVTPGGAGTLSIVDLGRRIVIATLSAGTGIRGIAVNTETETALLADPTSQQILLFSVLDQTVRSLQLETGHVASAVNPLADIGVTVNPTTDLVSVLDLRTPARRATLAGGTDPRAVAIDPGSNIAVVANEGSNDVTLISLGALRPTHITGISPVTTFTSTGDLTLTVLGHGFLNGSVVRLDGAPVATTFVSSRRLTATVPASLRAGPRRFAVDVDNPGSARTNVSDFAVFQAVAVGQQPRAVAIDPDRDLAVVANSGSNNASIVNLNTGAVTATVAVGTNPQGVAVYPRVGRAVVTNRGSNNASVIDLVAATVTDTVPVGTEPLGVAINPETGTAVVANSGSNNISFFSTASPPGVDTLAVDERPVAVAIFPERNWALVAHATANTLVIADVQNSVVRSRFGGFQIPTGAAFDPVTERFLAISSLNNNFAIVDPITLQFTQVRVGINPTSIAYNFQSSTLVTVNSASRTVSVMDFLERRVRAILPIFGSAQFAVAIHPRTNLAAIVDGENDRVLLVPLPR